METKELVEIVLSDLSGQLEEVTTRAIYEANGQITKELKETILLTQKAAIAHSHAYEAVVKLLSVAFKNNVRSVGTDKVTIIVDKAEKMKGNINTMKVVDEFYNKLAELEMVMYQLSIYGVVRDVVQHT